MVSGEALLAPLCSPEAHWAVEENFLWRESMSPIFGCCANASFQSSSLHLNHCSSASSKSSTRSSAGKKGSILLTHAGDPQHLVSSSMSCCLGKMFNSCKVIVVSCQWSVVSAHSPFTTHHLLRCRKPVHILIVNIHRRLLSYGSKPLLAIGCHPDRVPCFDRIPLLIEHINALTLQEQKTMFHNMCFYKWQMPAGIIAKNIHGHVKVVLTG